jgi:uncharacterized protein (TIGR00251 family)
VITLAVKVVPGAKRDRVVGRYGEGIKIQVSAPPEDGKANEAVLKVLAEALGVARSRLHLLRGHTQPRKLITIDGIDAAALSTFLAGLP